VKTVAEKVHANTTFVLSQLKTTVMISTEEQPMLLSFTKEKLKEMVATDSEFFLMMKEAAGDVTQNAVVT
jgi:hypothetical protein